MSEGAPGRVPMAWCSLCARVVVVEWVCGARLGRCADCGVSAEAVVMVEERELPGLGYGVGGGAAPAAGCGCGSGGGCEPGSCGVRTTLASAQDS